MLKSILILLVISINQNISCQSVRDNAIELLESVTKKFQINDLDGALSDIDKSIKLDSTYYAAYYNKGLIELKQEKYNEAFLRADKTLKINPEMIEAYALRSFLYNHFANYGKAISDCTAALSINRYSQYILF